MTPQEAEQALSPAPGSSALPEAKVLAGSLGYLSLPAVSSDRAAAAYVKQARQAVAELTGADELLVTTSTYDRTALLDSFGRLARLTGISSTTGITERSAVPGH